MHECYELGILQQEGQEADPEHIEAHGSKFGVGGQGEHQKADD